MKELNKDELEKRKKLNIKIFKFFLLPVLIFCTLLMWITYSDNSEIQTPEPDLGDKLNIGYEAVNKLIGSPFPIEKWEEWGAPTTLGPSNNQYWVVYLDSANISYVVNKNIDKIIFADFEKNSSIKFINKHTEIRDSMFIESRGKAIGYIKKGMHDEDSFEHVSSNYLDVEHYILLELKYRGKNAFGVKVLETLFFKFDLEGNIIETSN